MEKQELVIINRNRKRMPATLRIPEGEAKGTAVVLHGLAGWKDQSTVVVIAEAMAASGYTTLTFDGADCLRGPDASYWDSTTTSFLEDTEDAIAYVSEQEWFTPPLVLAGHSLGALVAVRYARIHAAVAKLVLVAPAISWTKDRSSRFLKKIRFATKVAKILSKRQKEQGEKFMMPLYPPWILDFLAYDTRRDAPHVPAPALIISAGDDLVVAGPAEHQKLTERFPHAEHQLIPGASHIFMEHEQELADTITKWLTYS